VVFKRRTPKSWALWALHLIWPQGGWGRAAHYVKHRVRRLPDSPNRISRGIFAGVFTTFCPFYGFHFFIAAGLAKLGRGNILAALMATFFGNPLTYLPIGVISLKTGHFLLGTEFEENMNLGSRFAGAGRDLKDNFKAIFTDDRADWSRLAGLSVLADYHRLPEPPQRPSESQAGRDAGQEGGEGTRQPGCLWRAALPL